MNFIKDVEIIKSEIDIFIEQVNEIKEIDAF
jgi:hypothetical protein